MIEATSFERFEGVQPYRIDFDEYVAMVGAGLFGDARVELVDGKLIELAPSQTRHSRVLGQVFASLHTAYAESDIELYIDAIAKLGSKTGRAPDMATVDRDIGDRKTLLPEDIALAIEISDSTLSEDLGRKRANYAEAGIRNYWVVDVEGKRVHRFAEPSGDADTWSEVSDFGQALKLPEVGSTIVIG